MSCSEFWNAAPELEPDNTANQEHLRECAACAALFEHQKQLAAGLRALRLDSSTTGAPPRVEAQLLAAFRAQSSAPKPKLVGSPMRAGWMLATAAAILLATGVWLVPKRASVPAARHSSPSRVELAAADELQTTDSGLDDGFIPLPNAERLEPGDDVNVVRMAVSRSALIAAGYDIAAEAAADSNSDMVEADVVLGPDGLARAVKFVENASSL